MAMNSGLLCPRWLYLHSQSAESLRAVSRVPPCAAAYAVATVHASIRWAYNSGGELTAAAAARMAPVRHWGAWWHKLGSFEAAELHSVASASASRPTPPHYLPTGKNDWIFVYSWRRVFWNRTNTSNYLFTLNCIGNLNIQQNYAKKQFTLPETSLVAFHCLIWKKRR